MAAIDASDDRRVHQAWLTSIVHAVGSSSILLATGLNIGLAAHYPLASAAAVLFLGAGIRRGSRMAALLLLLAAATPALVKVILGVIHITDAAALPLSIMYARGLAGTIRLTRAEARSASRAREQGITSASRGGPPEP